MEDKKYKLSGEMSLAVPIADADKLLKTGDGTAALLYLYAMRYGGDFSETSAAHYLKRTEAEISKALLLLCQMGLFKTNECDSKILPPADELPEYTAEDIASRARESGEFKVIIGETQRIMGHMLTGPDLKTLFGIYDYLHLPAEVIILMINHCVEETRERLGPGKLPSMHSIEKEAYVWYNREILTLEAAEEFLMKKRAQSGNFADIKRLLQINGRNFSASERKYVEAWLDMGFELDAIALAYDKTVIKTGNLAWKYMNSILTSWHEKKLHTAEEVTSGDRRASSSSSVRIGSPATEKGSGESESDRMKRIWDKVKNG
jgi:DnaD/phage-associated family protein